MLRLMGMLLLLVIRCGKPTLNPGPRELGAVRSFGVPSFHSSPGSPAKVWFVPNQMAGSLWYKPGGQAINGHVENSFGDFSLWPTARAHLKSAGGGFGIYASEVRHLSRQTVNRFRAEGIPLSVEDPIPTQCLDGYALAYASTGGYRVQGRNLFCEVFKICGSDEGAPNPDSRGF